MYLRYLAYSLPLMIICSLFSYSLLSTGGKQKTAPKHECVVTGQTAADAADAECRLTTQAKAAASTDVIESFI